MLVMLLETLASPAEDAALVRLTGGKSTEQQIEITSWTTGVLVFLVVLWALFGPKLSRFHLTEGSAACLLGLLCGCLLLAMRHYIAQQAVVQRLLAFSAASFFTYLLPPVIFYAGLSIEKTLFFSNLGSILALGVVGTAFAALLLAAFLAAGFAGLKLLRLQDCLALGAIFSATDSVATLQVLNPDRQPVLFSLVFGEGVINDATSVVLLGAVSTIFPQGAGAGGETDPASQASGWEQLGGLALTFLYLFFTSLALGAATGMGISCLVVRFAAHGPHHEVALIGLLSYLSYLAAEVLGLSGILSLFCCGLTVSHFALDGISTLGRTTTLNAFHTMSYICEGIIFIYLGMDALDPAKWNAAHPGEALSLCGALLLLLVVARGASVLPITALHNWLHPVKLSSTDIVIIWWSGLMRGAVSVALAYYYFDIGSPSGSSGDSHRSTLIAATLVVVLTSVMLLGAATQPLMQLLMDEPELGLLDKIGRWLRNSQTHAKGCAANIISATCCCLSGRGPRATYPTSADRSLTKKHSMDTPAGGRSGASRSWWGGAGKTSGRFEALPLTDVGLPDSVGRLGNGNGAAAEGSAAPVVEGAEEHGDMELGVRGGASAGRGAASADAKDVPAGGPGRAVVGSGVAVVGAGGWSGVRARRGGDSSDSEATTRWPGGNGPAGTAAGGAGARWSEDGGGWNGGAAGEGAGPDGGAAGTGTLSNDGTPPGRAGPSGRGGAGARVGRELSGTRGGTGVAGAGAGGPPAGSRTGSRTG